MQIRGVDPVGVVEKLRDPDLVEKLRTAPIVMHPAKDLLRSSGLELLGLDAAQREHADLGALGDLFEREVAGGRSST